MITEGMFTSEHDDWNTPEVVLERVRMLGTIGLDPCSNPQSTVRAAVEWRLDHGQDALRLDWNGHGLVFCNPPYGGAVGAAFMRRMALYAALGVEIVALVPNRTDTEWYQENTRLVSAKCEWYGRLSHPRGQAVSNQTTLWEETAPIAGKKRGTAPFPSVVLYWGPQTDRFVEAFGDCGAVWRSAQRAVVKPTTVELCSTWNIGSL